MSVSVNMGFLQWADKEPERAEEAMVSFRHEGSHLTYEEMTRQVPVRTGFLKRSISIVFTPERFTVYPAAQYALFAEYGVRPHGIAARMARALRFNPIYVTFKQCIAFVQALIAWAYNYWDANYGSDHCTNIKKALDQIISLDQGRWRGFMEHMLYTAYDYPAEYIHYAALMRTAINKVDVTRYARFH